MQSAAQPPSPPSLLVASSSTYAEALRKAKANKMHSESYLVPYFSTDEVITNSEHPTNTICTAIGWPATKPSAEVNDTGWFLAGNRLAIRKVLGGTCVGVTNKNGNKSREIDIILELGAYLGKSTRFLCQHAKSAATVYTCDAWDNDYLGDF